MDERKRLTVTEREALMRVNLAHSIIVNHREELARRTALVPRGSWYLGVARAMLEKYLDGCYRTMPPEQERILKEYVEGDTIFDLVLRDEMKEDYIHQMQSICQKLYAAHTNIDYFPTNLIVCDGKLVYVDYECNDYMEQWDFENWGIKYWSKTPEFMLYLQEHQG